MAGNHAYKQLHRFSGLTLNLFMQMAVVVFLVAALLYTMFFTTYMPVHDFFHHLRHALAIIPCH